MRLGRSAVVLTLWLLTGLAAQTASAQRRRFAPPPPPKPPRTEGRRANSNAKAGNSAPNANNPAGAKGQQNLRGMAQLPPKWIEQLRDRSPEEQERFLRNNQRFQNLPPQRQAQILRNLQNWNRRSPTEQAAIRDRERILEQMSPAQRETIKNNLLPKWQQMSPDRRQLVNGRLHTLQGMSAADREAALNNPKFMQGLTPDEQSVLRSLNSLRNPTSPNP